MTEATTQERELIHAELEAIRTANGGLISPEKVVEFAKSELTALHGRFTWDDTEAAKQHRLWEARQIVRIFVTFAPDDAVKQHQVRMYCSLDADRKSDGGYRLLTDIMSHAEMRKQLLNQALRDFRLFREKYQTLKELEPIFSAAESVEHANGEEAA